MADVFQIIAVDIEHPWFEPDLVENGFWHAAYSIDDPRTICGIQLVGEDGISAGPTKKGKVTCPTCRNIIAQIQSIKNWR